MDYDQILSVGPTRDNADGVKRGLYASTADGWWQAQLDTVHQPPVWRVFFPDDGQDAADILQKIKDALKEAS